MERKGEKNEQKENSEVLANCNCEHHDRHDQLPERPRGGGAMKVPPSPSPNVLTAFQYVMENHAAGKVIGAAGICVGAGIFFGSATLYRYSSAALKGV